MSARNPSATCATCPKLKIGNFLRGVVEWDEISPPLSGLDDVLLYNGSPLTFVLANPETVFTCPACKALLMETFHIPLILGSKLDPFLPGYYGEERVFDSSGCLQGIATWFRINAKQMQPSYNSEARNTWWHHIIATYWSARSGSSTALLFHPDRLVQERLLETCILPILDRRDLVDTMQGHLDPYYINALFMEGCVILQNLAVGSIHQLVRVVEVSRSTLDPGQDLTSFLRVQDSGRHCIQVRTRLESAIDLVITLKAAHRDWIESHCPGHMTRSCRSVSSRLNFCQSALQSLLFRVNGHISRTSNELQLAGNLASLEIARTAAKDAEVIKTLSVFGAFLIAPTFVAALFSTSFFTIDDAGNWYLHQKFWVYWAVSIPYSCITILIIAWAVGYRLGRG